MSRLSRIVCFWMVTWFTPSTFAAPAIFWASDPVQPGETVLVVGNGFGDKPAVRVERLADDAGKPATSMTVQTMQASDQSLKFLLPDDLTAGVYRVQISTGKDAATWLLNRPDVYWAQGDQGTSATPGGWVRVFGRNISEPAMPAVMTLSAGGGAPQRLTATSATPWEARFAIPAGLRPGEYRLRISNGRGGEAAVADAGMLRVAPAEASPERQFNVRDFGAVGDGRADDTPAVQTALEAAGQGGGVVYFPRGRYQLTGAVTIARGVRLRGERRDWVSVFWPDMDAPPEALLRGSNHFGLENLTLYASNYRHLVVGDLEPTAAGEPGHVRIDRVTIRAVRYRGHLKPEQVDERYRNALQVASGDTLRLGGENISITDSDIYGSGRALYLKQPRGAYIARNRFYNGRNGWYSLSGVDGVIFEDNEITGADLAATGGGINTLGRMAYSQNVYFARNTLSLMHGWDREAMTSDGPGGYYYGGVEAAGAQALTLTGAPVDQAGPPERWRGAGVFVLSGRGMGQFAQVRDVQGATVEMDRPWQIAPDTTSVLTIAPMQQNYLFIDNSFTDAGVALQYYGTSVNHIAAGNKSTRTGGFLNIGKWYRHYQPSWYCQFLGNEILEGNVYRGGPNNATRSGEAVIGTFGSQKPPNTAPLALASILRGNHLQSNAHLKVDGGNDRAAPGVRDVIVENNVVENAEVGLAMSTGVTGLWARGNRFSNVSEPERTPGGN